ncbi:hypothetical protein, partial [Terribacillus saccharophilus]|uniref:hypothetical protein n=1 Tax=Terribacillus saccharophilus TaxID=361277 RepID=UPI000BDA3203
SLPGDVLPFVLIPKDFGIKKYIKSEYRNMYEAGTLRDELLKRNIPFFEAYYFLDNINIKQNLIKKI